MSDIINLLPDSIANQIAAGEVVQRPASVVKELLENSVDAGAQKIQLIIKDAGKAIIHIIDDGIGMSETDARMSFERHATSKIQSADDLFSIRTMGFRGEALASIAAIAQVELKTRREEDELGIHLLIEASEKKKKELVNTQKGTSICVKNLFYNVPARRNFLKSNPVEMRHIIDEFQRVALANPEIAFTFHQNDLEVNQLEKGKLSKRIISLFGKNYQKQLVPCEEETPHLKVVGYIGKPEFSKKTRGEQFFFVNNRFIKSNYLNHAVNNAYEGLISKEQYPFYVLFIDIDPKHIDINVHPTKTEIKFEDERTVYGIIRSAVRQSLGAHNVTPSLDFSSDTNFEAFTDLIKKDNSQRATGNERNYGQFKSDKLESSNLRHWEKLYDFAGEEGKVDDETIRKEGYGGDISFENLRKEESPQEHITFTSNVNTEKNPRQDADELDHTGSRNSLQLHGKYIFRQIRSGMMIVEQHYAHERILYERYLEMLKNKSGASQHCLFPQAIDLSMSDFALVMELKEEITAIGFNFELFGEQTILVNGIPSDLNGGNEKEIFEGLIEQFKRNKSELSVSNVENLARAISKRAAVKINSVLQREEIDSLIDQLFACDQPNYTPGGQPTFVILSLDKIGEFFNA
ncbi:MAG: DNA mismatch repair endonuclease MutL [Cyclobacteriaceae bacterium]